MHHRPISQRRKTLHDKRQVRPLALAALITFLSGTGQLPGSESPAPVPPPRPPPAAGPVTPLPWNSAPSSVPTPVRIVPPPMAPPPAPGTGQGPRRTGSLAASLDRVAVTRDLGRATTVTRLGVLTQMESLVQACHRGLAERPGPAPGIKDEDRRRSEAANTAMQASENVLLGSLANARQSTENTWNAARDKLAADYQSYVQAVAEAEAMLAPPTSGTPQP